MTSHGRGYRNTAFSADSVAIRGTVAQDEDPGDKTFQGLAVHSGSVSPVLPDIDR